jgi:UDP-4-amino-4,6-dideoxy-N-acetyl-beta-L-altrosamine transaminase
MIPYGHQWIDEDDRRAVADALRDEWITSGPRGGEFEARLADSIGCRHAIAVNSGTSALDIAVQSLELPRGSEIITTPFTFVATSNAILYHGHKPVFADIEEETRNIDPEAVRRQVGPRTRAIIAVDYAGHPCELAVLREIADECDLFLIEDACHAIGATYRGQRIGTLADLTVFSFHPVKHITTGEGGAVVTDDRERAEKLRLLRNHGIDRSAMERFQGHGGWAYDQILLGRNYRLTDFQAALGISQLAKLEGFLVRRESIARRYQEVFRDIPEIHTPVVRDHVRHAWHLYTILLDGVDREEFFTGMRNHGIGVNVHYIPVYHFTYYRKKFRISPRKFPVTESVFQRIITLPIYPRMTNSEVDQVIEATRSEIRSLGK